MLRKDAHAKAEEVCRSSDAFAARECALHILCSYKQIPYAFQEIRIVIHCIMERFGELILQEEEK